MLKLQIPKNGNAWRDGQFNDAAEQLAAHFDWEHEHLNNGIWQLLDKDMNIVAEFEVWYDENGTMHIEHCI